MNTLHKILAEDCSILPDSPFPSVTNEKGCPGAVWTNGDPNGDICRNIGTAADRFPWYRYCCKWQDTKCLPKDPGEYEVKVCQQTKKLQISLQCLP